MFKNILLIIGLFNIVVHVKSGSNRENITKTILSVYDKTVKPNGQVNLDISVIIRQIVTIDEKAKAITTNALFSIEWKDSRLTWDPANYNNINKMLIKSNKLWLPDLSVVNSAESDRLLKIPSNNQAILNSNGLINLIVGAPLLKTSCDINIMKFPYDEHKCDIRLVSSMKSNNDIRINQAQVTSSDYIDNLNFEFLNANVSIAESNNKFIKNMPSYFTNEVDVKLHIKRRPGYHMINGFYPAYFLNLMTLLIYFVSNDEHIKMTIDVIVTLCVYLIKVMHETPISSNYWTLANVYFFFSFIYCILTYFWGVIAYQMRYQKFMPRPIEIVCVFIRRALIDPHYEYDNGIELSDLTPNDESSNGKITISNRQGFDPKELEAKKKAHVDKCVNILHYIVHFSMFLMILTVDIVLWIVIVT